MTTRFVLIVQLLLIAPALAQYPAVTVLHHLSFELLGTNETQIQMMTTYTPQPREPFESEYRLATDTLKHEVTLPDGNTFIFAVTNRATDEGHTFAIGREFIRGTYRVIKFDDWRQVGSPNLNQPGTYSYREIGAFAKPGDKDSDISYTSTVARWVVEESVLSIPDLKDRVRTNFGVTPTLIHETTNHIRVVSFTLPSKIIPEEWIPLERRNGGNYTGVRWTFHFTPQGEILSMTNAPVYIIVD